MTVFVDTSAFFALLDRMDPQHERASGRMQRLAGQEELLTHGYVVSETVALARRRLGAASVHALIEKLLPLVTTVMIDENAHEAALAALDASLPHAVSFVDLVSFQIMRAYGITRAFAFDDDFEQAGFTTSA